MAGKTSKYGLLAVGRQLVRLAFIVGLGMIAAVPTRGAILHGSINNVTVKYKVPCDGATKTVNLGTLQVALANEPKVQRMVALFTVNPAVGPGASIWNCMALHYIQIITADACPARVAGTPAGSPGFPFPVVDTPAHGWDYIYNDNDHPADGIQADERVPGNVTGPTWADDARDTLPWYHTLEEEAGLPGSGFAGFNPGVSYEIDDRPGFCAHNGVTAFSTYLVAVPKLTCPDSPDCLKTNDILLLAGYSWTWARNNITLSMNAPNAGVVQQALANTGFTGWTVKDDGTVCCPEPSSMAMISFMMIVCLCVGWRQRSRLK